MFKLFNIIGTLIIICVKQDKSWTQINIFQSVESSDTFRKFSRIDFNWSLYWYMPIADLLLRNGFIKFAFLNSAYNEWKHGCIFPGSNYPENITNTHHSACIR